jgi:hypothetical protein
MGNRKELYWDLVGKPEGKRPLRRPRHRWEHNIKTGGRRGDAGAWTGSSWLRIGQLVGACGCGTVLPVSIKCVEFLD